MLHSHCHRHLLLPNLPVTFAHAHNPSLSLSLSLSLSSPLLTFLHRRTTFHSVSAFPRALPELWLAQISEPTTIAIEEGPVELPFSSPSIFDTTDDPSFIQVATSVLLTVAVTVFLLRSLRRRAKRAKELKFRSSGVKKSMTEVALDSLKAMGSVSIESNDPPSPVQALLGGISAGVIALILYRFTTTIEAALNRQTISDNLSVRQITLTIRTIINGLCYLATFVFGINSVGLFLYSGQLAINSFMEDDTNQETESKGTEESGISAVESPTDTSELSSNKED
ncbi:Transmembrane protein [Quillaja saponaria]|uniref:Transmembrane protein n=1 Tax=Quillaja saponaria TaxID=32244 RepID=A0AAD7KZX1_QUISA|nr:Transmembrane protein [Quillaja saponaria]KAJ7948699.1 Transmembrane protein [Quillaja saponaria]